MAEATNPADDTGIHYEVSGDGPPLVMLVGVTCSVAQWRLMGFQQAFEDTYQVIAIDSRGHGASDKPHEAQAYGTAKDVQDVCAVLDAVGVERAHFFGYSMGARIALAFGLRHPGRLRSLAAAAPARLVQDGPSAAAGIPSTDILVTAMQELYEARGVEVGDEFRAALARNDVEALSARSDGGQQEQLDLDWSSASWPALLCVGTNDDLLEPAKELAKLLPQGELLELAGVDHIGTISPRHHDRYFPQVRRLFEMAP